MIVALRNSLVLSDIKFSSVWQRRGILPDRWPSVAFPGERGGQTVLDIALGRFPYMGGKIVGSMSFPSFFDNFKEGEIVNDALKSNLLKLVEDYKKEI